MLTVVVDVVVDVVPGIRVQGVDFLLEGLVDVGVRCEVEEHAGQGRCCGVAVVCVDR